MVTLRAFETLLAGLAVTAFFAIAMAALLGRLAPDWSGEVGAPKAGPAFVNLGFSFLSVAAGGYVTAWAAVGNPLPYVLVLGVVVLLLTGLGALQGRGKRPLKYQSALVAIGPAGVVAGGLVRLRVMGIL